MIERRALATEPNLGRREVAASAYVAVENFCPGLMAGLNLAYQDLQSEKPRDRRARDFDL
jgi:crotonobetainyl-CoA:carnitine CoA-transferase CaiB-like acyl-CoA transferase